MLSNPICDPHNPSSPPVLPNSHYASCSVPSSLSGLTKIVSVCPTSHGILGYLLTLRSNSALFSEQFSVAQICVHGEGPLAIIGRNTLGRDDLVPFISINASTVSSRHAFLKFDIDAGNVSICCEKSKLLRLTRHPKGEIMLQNQSLELRNGDLLRFGTHAFKINVHLQVSNQFLTI